MQAMVHAKTCIQCGLCPAVCPDVFTLEPGEPARAISGPVPEECRLAAQEAADSCPGHRGALKAVPFFDTLKKPDAFASGFLIHSLLRIRLFGSLPSLTCPWGRRSGGRSCCRTRCRRRSRS